MHSNKGIFWLQSRRLKQLYTMYIDQIHIIYLAAPLARADKIQTGIQSVIYMKGQDFSFVISLGIYRHIRIVFLFKSFSDILISGCSGRNIVKQTDVSI